MIGAVVLAAGAVADAHAEFTVPLAVEWDPVVLVDAMVAVRFGPPFARRDRPRVTLTSRRKRTRALAQFDGLLARALLGAGSGVRADIVPAASRSWIAVTLTRTRTIYDGAGEATQVLSSETQVARRRGPARTVAHCARRALEPIIDGQLLAYVNCERTAIVVHDLTQPAAVPEQIALPPGSQAGVPTLAGPYVSTILSPRRDDAFEAQPPPQPVEETLAVFERPGGRQITRVPGLQIDSVALRDDATVVMTAAPLGALRLAPDECHFDALSLVVVARGGQPRSLNHTACGNPLTLDGDWILFSHRTRNGIGWALTDVHGATPRELADRRYDAAFARDGLVRLGSPACDGRPRVAFIATARLLATGPDPVRRCTLRYPTQTVPVDRHGALRIAYRCPAGCTGTMRLYLHGTRRLIQLRARSGSRVKFDAAPGQRATVHARLSPRFRVLLRLRGRLTVDAIATVPQIEDASDRITDTLRFRARLTLRR